MGIDRYFCGSCDEATYRSIRLQPIVFRDDIARISSNLRKAQAGNHKLSFIVKEKQLRVHPDKTGFIAILAASYQIILKMRGTVKWTSQCGEALSIYWFLLNCSHVIRCPGQFCAFHRIGFLTKTE